MNNDSFRALLASRSETRQASEPKHKNAMNVAPRGLDRAALARQRALIGSKMGGEGSKEPDSGAAARNKYLTHSGKEPPLTSDLVGVGGDDGASVVSLSTRSAVARGVIETIAKWKRKPQSRARRIVRNDNMLPFRQAFVVKLPTRRARSAQDFIDEPPEVVIRSADDAAALLSLRLAAGAGALPHVDPRLFGDSEKTSSIVAAIRRWRSGEGEEIALARDEQLKQALTAASEREERQRAVLAEAAKAEPASEGSDDIFSDVSAEEEEEGGLARVDKRTGNAVDDEVLFADEAALERQHFAAADADYGVEGLVGFGGALGALPRDHHILSSLAADDARKGSSQQDDANRKARRKKQRLDAEVRAFADDSSAPASKRRRTKQNPSGGHTRK